MTYQVYRMTYEQQPVSARVRVRHEVPLSRKATPGSSMEPTAHSWLMSIPKHTRHDAPSSSVPATSGSKVTRSNSVPAPSWSKVTLQEQFSACNQQVKGHQEQLSTCNQRIKGHLTQEAQCLQPAGQRSLNMRSSMPAPSRSKVTKSS